MRGAQPSGATGRGADLRVDFVARSGAAGSVAPGSGRDRRRRAKSGEGYDQGINLRTSPTVTNRISPNRATIP